MAKRDTVNIYCAEYTNIVRTIILS